MSSGVCASVLCQSLSKLAHRRSSSRVSLAAHQILLRNFERFRSQTQMFTCWRSTNYDRDLPSQMSRERALVSGGASFVAFHDLMSHAAITTFKKIYSPLGLTDKRECSASSSRSAYSIDFTCQSHYCLFSAWGNHSNDDLEMKSRRTRKLSGLVY